MKVLIYLLFLDGSVEIQILSIINTRRPMLCLFTLASRLGHDRRFLFPSHRESTAWRRRGTDGAIGCVLEIFRILQSRLKSLSPADDKSQSEEDRTNADGAEKEKRQMAIVDSEGFRVIGFAHSNSS